jgi:hypothetical protein
MYSPLLLALKIANDVPSAKNEKYQCNLLKLEKNMEGQREAGIILQEVCVFCHTKLYMMCVLFHTLPDKNNK